MTICYLPLNLINAESMVFQLNWIEVGGSRGIRQKCLILPKFYKVSLSAFLLSLALIIISACEKRSNNINTWFLIYNENYFKSNFNDFFVMFMLKSITTSQILQKNIYECMKKYLYGQLTHYLIGA